MNSLAALCRSCGKAGLRLVLSLGETPLANGLLTIERLTLPESSVSLRLAFWPRYGWGGAQGPGTKRSRRLTEPQLTP